MTFGASLSGINTTSTAMEVVGNNLANASVFGFKSSRSHFSDLVQASLANVSSSQTAGVGTGELTIVQEFTQGNIATSPNALDIAVNGQGFFRLNDGVETTYSRNGQFHLEGELDRSKINHTTAELKAQKMLLVNTLGINVTGYPADATGKVVTTGSPGKLSVESSLPGVATKNVVLSVNLNPVAKVAVDGDGKAIPFDPNNPESHNGSTPVKSYDALGNAYDLRTYFVRTAAADSWQVYTSFDKSLGSLDYPFAVAAGSKDQFSISLGGDPAATVSLPPSAAGYASVADLKAAFQSAADKALGKGVVTISLDTDNHLMVKSTTGAAVKLSEGNGALASYFGSAFQLAGDLVFDAFGNPNPRNEVFALNHGGSLPAIQLDLSGVTQYAAADFGSQDVSVNFLTQDGSPKGQLLDVSIDEQGILQARYTNAETVPAGQLVLAKFANPDGLFNLGLKWLETTESGAAKLDTPGSNAEGSLALGPLMGSALEEANVDISAQLLDLITLQRAYQANSEAIKAQDKLFETLGNIR